MEYSTLPYSYQGTNKGIPFGIVFVLSVIFHLAVLVGLPLMGYLLWKPRQFERPKTFQLVSLPVRPNAPRKVDVPKESPKQRVAQEKSTPAKVPGPAPKQPVTKEKPQPNREPAQSPDQNLNELESLLDEIPAPAQVSAIGEFKYPWYLTNVQNKIQHYWNPPSENKNLKVVVAFTIFNDGTISEPTIAKSSGDRSIDNLALRAVKLAAPFGKLSVGFNAKSVDINVTLNPTTRK